MRFQKRIYSIAIHKSFQLGKQFSADEDRTFLLLF